MKWPLAAVLVVAMVCATFVTYLLLGYAADGAPSAPRPTARTVPPELRHCNSEGTCIVRPGEVFP